MVAMVRRVSIASASQLAADAGAAVADIGGNAIDAAIAAIVTSMCAEPGIVAPGASGFITIDPAGGEAVVFDAYAEMPGRAADPDRFGHGHPVSIDYGGGLDTIIGYSSVAAPGIYSGLEEAWRRYGTLPWKVLFEPAIGIIEHGFPLGLASAEYLMFSHDEIFSWDPASRAAFHHDDGSPLVVGDTVRIPFLADSLRDLAHHGAAALYRGDLGAAIVEAVDAAGGLLGRVDLKAYRAVERRPVRFQLGGWEVDTNPAPAVGGAAMAAIAMLAEHRGFSGWTTDGVAVLARTQREVIDYRRSALRDSDAIERFSASLLESVGAEEIGRLITSPSTSHTSAADSDGNVCAVTVSAGYGAGAMPPGTGFGLNNSLGELELHPAGYHGLEPGTRLISNMAPTTARGPDSVLAVGSPGADRITTAISSVLLNFLVGGMSIDEAIEHPRIHAEVFEGRPTIAFESGLPIGAVEGETREFADRSMYFGGVAAAMLSPAGLSATSDPRRAGGVAHST